VQVDQRWRELGVNLLVTALSLLVFFGLAEVGARLGGYAPYTAQADVFRHDFDASRRATMDLFISNETRIWELRPGFVGQRADWGDRSWITITINAQGWRDDEVTLSKPAGVFRIALVGDSVTFGGRVEAKNNFATQLEWNLDAQAPGRFQVLNFGVPGYSTWQELSLLQDKVWNYAPDLVLLSFVMNDLYDNNQASQLDYLSMSRLQGVAKFMREHSAFYRFMREKLLTVRAQAANRDPCAGQDPSFCWNATWPLLDQFIVASRQRQVPFAVVIFPVDEQMRDQPDPNIKVRYQDELRAYAEKNQIPAIDLLGAFVEYRDAGLFVDNYHPTEFGHSVAAVVILDQLKAYRLIPLP
jgi:lysophospholipase L1-like esterase